MEKCLFQALNLRLVKLNLGSDLSNQSMGILSASIELPVYRLKSPIKTLQSVPV